ncbi:multicopper oxidase [Hypoxylon sp. FL0890]|nr:multicopper oxidase [Hypoxylon sp. FL0890]
MLRHLVSALAFASSLPLALGLSSPLRPLAAPREFDLTLTWQKHAPNGVSRDMALINGQFPGPLLEVNEGDEVWITVHNKMPFPTTMHFHGIEQYESPWSDGVPGVTQREIPTGGSFVYKWTATQYGEYWYHAHHKGQLADGQYGSLIIHPRSSTPTPFNLISKDPQTLSAMEKAAANVKPLILSDWRNIDSSAAWDIEIEASVEIPCFDSLLINGQGKVDCWSADKLASLLQPTQKVLLGILNMTSLTPKGCLPAPVAALTLAAGFPTNVSNVPPEIFDICTPTNSSNPVYEIHESSCDKNGTWAAFDVVGAYSTVVTTFSIDGLSLWVYSVDGEYIEPQLVDAIGVKNGDRYAFLVHLTSPGDYTIRHASTLPVQLISSEATLTYKSTGSAPKNPPPSPWVNDAGVAVGSNVIFFNQSTQKAFPPSPVGQTADQTVVLSLGNTEGLGYMWSMNGTSEPMSLDTANPILFEPQPNLMNNLTITTLNGTWVDLIFQVAQVPQPAHPIHKHGNKMYLIGSGQGLFNYTSVAEAIKVIPGSFNLVDPPHRDGFSTLDSPRAPTWIAVRYQVTNPGAWFLHCHIETHLDGGMAMVIQDGVDAFPKIPDEYLSYGA